ALSSAPPTAAPPSSAERGGRRRSLATPTESSRAGGNPSGAPRHVDGWRLITGIRPRDDSQFRPQQLAARCLALVGEAIVEEAVRHYAKREYVVQPEGRDDFHAAIRPQPRSDGVCLARK